MAIIRASCPDCGDAELSTRDVTVRVCRDNDQRSYTFRCPACAMTVCKETDDRVVQLLVTSGVDQVDWWLPREMDERHTGAPFTEADVVAFRLLLAEDGWISHLEVE